MKELQKQLKAGDIKNVYLFYGEERFLIKTYEVRLKEHVMDPAAEMMNFHKFEGKSFSLDTMRDLAETQPFMSQYRLIIMEDTKLFVSGRKDDSEKMTAILDSVPESTVILFTEREIDKRSKLYKKLVEKGRAVEFKTPSEKEYISWVIKVVKSLGGVIAPDDAAYLIQTVGGEMEAVRQECHKLCAYTANRPGNTITRSDIDDICIKSLETKIFRLTDAIGNKKTKEALSIYANLLLMKESPIMVLTMIARQIRLILACRLAAEKKLTAAEMAQTLGLRSFVVTECLKQGKNFSKEILYSALEDCLETDVSIKMGLLGDKLGVELLIIKYGA